MNTFWAIFFILIFKGHLYKLHHIFPIPYKGMCWKLSLLGDLGLPFWTAVTVRSDFCQAPYLIPELHWVCWVVFSMVLQYYQGHTVPHTAKHTLYLLPFRGILWGRQYSPHPDSYHLPSYLEPARLLWQGATFTQRGNFPTYPEQCLSVMLICWQVLRGCFWRFLPFFFIYKIQNAFIWIGDTKRNQNLKKKKSSP